jgi:hypothetical protein
LCFVADPLASLFRIEAHAALENYRATVYVSLHPLP